MCAPGCERARPARVVVWVRGRVRVRVGVEVRVKVRARIRIGVKILWFPAALPTTRRGGWE